MASVHDVAAYILERQGSMSTMKLQKLVYYSQAWHLAWRDEPLFNDDIQAWANGPVVYSLFDIHRKRFEWSPPWPEGSSNDLDEAEREVVNGVLKAYGPLTGRQLSMLTHQEEPWRKTRRGLAPTERSNAVIDLNDMLDFYAGLDSSDEAVAIADIDWVALGDAG